jgi:hypothetical protein
VTGQQKCGQHALGNLAVFRSHFLPKGCHTLSASGSAAMNFRSSKSISRLIRVAHRTVNYRIGVTAPVDELGLEAHSQPKRREAARLYPRSQKGGLPFQTTPRRRAKLPMFVSCEIGIFPALLIRISLTSDPSIGDPAGAPNRRSSGSKHEC